MTLFYTVTDTTQRTERITWPQRQGSRSGATSRSSVPTSASLWSGSLWNGLFPDSVWVQKEKSHFCFISASGDGYLMLDTILTRLRLSVCFFSSDSCLDYYCLFHVFIWVFLSLVFLFWCFVCLFWGEVSTVLPKLMFPHHIILT